MPRARAKPNKLIEFSVSPWHERTEKRASQQDSTLGHPQVRCAPLLNKEVFYSEERLNAQPTLQRAPQPMQPAAPSWQSRKPAVQEQEQSTNDTIQRTQPASQSLDQMDALGGFAPSACSKRPAQTAGDRPSKALAAPGPSVRTLVRRPSHARPSQTLVWDDSDEELGGSVFQAGCSSDEMQDIHLGNNSSGTWQPNEPNTQDGGSCQPTQQTETVHTSHASLIPLRRVPVRIDTVRRHDQEAAVGEVHEEDGSSCTGFLRIARLPSGGISGHFILPASRACFGIMGARVGSASSGCRGDEDAEVLRLRVIGYGSRQAPAVCEVGAVVLATGGDLARWQPATAGELSRALGRDLTGTEEEEVAEVGVVFNASTLMDGPEADASLAKWSGKLVGRGAWVNTGPCTVTNLPKGFLNS